MIKYMCFNDSLGSVASDNHLYMPVKMSSSKEPNH